ncbi:H/ACA ribonucleoprotein complex non-core subunit NAF1 [Canna indica]|uniref:H/ACA ribonucleoprotein complex non-core subunit NAF1 n=1 Tax=Canna indica TaxID=4628 RepID=A0AAQ3QM65_9LILI|nr:H/ACA ribonucleoprotein complex non-core subunit NAF1 [Canna indica]
MMDDRKRNPSSPEDGLAHGPPSLSPTSNSSVEALVESRREEQGSSFREVAEGEAVSISAAPNSDAFASNGPEHASPLDGKMESVNMTGNFDDHLPDTGVAAVEGEERREEPLAEDDDSSGDDGSIELEADDSESDESSSEDSDSSTSTSSEEEEEVCDRSHGEGGEGLEVLIGSDDEEDAVRGPIKSMNELEVLPSVPKVEVSLKPYHQTFPVGVISSVLGNRVIVEGSMNHKPLDEGSIIWITETRTPLGIVDEIFGPVKNPYYVVRHNSEKDVPIGISSGTAVSFVMDFANYVLDKDLRKKGYDASGEHDEEISNEVEFSDDEKEAEYKKSLRQGKRGTDSRKFGKQEKGTSNKKSHVRGAGAQKGMMSPGLHGSGALEHSVPSQNAPCMAPSYQLPQQPNAILNHGILFSQQMNASLVYRMLMPPQQQLPLAIPTQQLLNSVLTHGMPPAQHQQIAALAGPQMNWPRSPQLGNQAYFQQHHNDSLMDNPYRMQSEQQLLQTLGTPAMPQMGLFNSSTSFLPPMLVPHSGVGQASTVHGMQGVPGLRSNQFNPGSSSVRGIMPHGRGRAGLFRRGK